MSEFEVRLLEAGDEAVLERVADGVFDHPPTRPRSREFLEDPRHHIAVALVDGVVVGFASGVHYVHPDKAPELWINEVGVAPGNRRRGVGRRLLIALGERGKSLGCAEAWVLTELANEPATALYRSMEGATRDDAAVLHAWPLT